MELNRLMKLAGMQLAEAVAPPLVNVGSDKWPSLVKQTSKMTTKSAEGATYKIHDFKAPPDGDNLVVHGGESYSFTGKKGCNNKTGAASYEYSRAGTASRAWIDEFGGFQED